MKHRKKSLWLQVFVVIIIFMLLFSVIGIVVVYLNGAAQQQAISDISVTPTINNAEGITITPKSEGSFVVTDDLVENTPSEEIIGEGNTVDNGDNQEGSNTDTAVDTNVEIAPEETEITIKGDEEVSN